MNYRLEEILDTEKIYDLLQEYYKITGTPSAIVDIDGNILRTKSGEIVGAGWQRICLEFHRINPETLKNCIKSDTVLSKKLSKGKTYACYKCLQGLVDIAVPIVLRGEHLANLFTGQFFFEKPDIEFFRRQAKRYGFDEKVYIETLSEVPIIKEEDVEKSMKFLTKLTEHIGETGLKQLELNKKNNELERANIRIEESEKRYSKAEKVGHIGNWEYYISKRLFWASEETKILFGFDIQTNYFAYDEVIDCIIDSSKVNQAIMNLINNERPYNIEFGIIQRNTGKKLILNSVSDLIKDERGDPVKIIGIVQDITERKNSEETLREKNEKIAVQNAELTKLNEELSQTKAEIHKQLQLLTLPLDDSSNINFDDLFDVNEIQKIQDTFAYATGVASIITFPDGKPITKPSNFCRLCNDIIRKTKKGLTNCFKSDAVIGRLSKSGPIIQPCLSGGLWDAGASITLGGKHIANWLIGQVKNEDIAPEKVLKYAEEIGADKEEFKKAFDEVSEMSKEQFTNVANFLYLFANELSFKAYQNVQQARLINTQKETEEALKIKNDEITARNEEYIKLNEKLNQTNNRLKIAKIKVEESEKEYRLLFESMTAGFATHEIILDETGTPCDYKFISANSSFEKITGLKVKNIIGLKVSEVLPNIESIWIENYGKVALTGEELHFENYNSDIKKYFEVSAYQIRYGSFATFFNDITERKQTEEEMRGKNEEIEAQNEELIQANDELIQAKLKAEKSEEELNKFFTLVPDMICMASPEGYFIKVNAAWKKTLGYSEEELLRTPYIDLVHPEDVEATIIQNQKLIEGHSIENFINRYRCKDGTYKWIEWMSAPVTITKSIIFAAARDITGRKLAEIELKNQKIFFEQLFSQSPVSTQIFDKDGWCERINPSLSKLFGIKPEDIEGKFYNIFQDEAIKEGRLMQHIKKVFYKKKQVEWEIIYDIKKASEATNIESSKKDIIYLYNWAYPILDDKGNLAHVIIQLTDNTKRRQAEEELKSKNEELIKTNEELTRAKQKVEENEELFRLFMEYSPIYIFFKDENIRSFYLTKNFEKMLGKPLNELLGKNMYELFPSEMAKNMIEDDKRVMLEGKTVEIIEELNGRIYSTVKFPVTRGGKPVMLAGFT
ncbi:MAG: PocR ligand-binding domain-containing protein, partial [Bacteroidota bacterium]|nr:PocR ligand-binding domain-containing protein [Bacteroidota bacterium]